MRGEVRREEEKNADIGFQFGNFGVAGSQQAREGGRQKSKVEFSSQLWSDMLKLL